MIQVVSYLYSYQMKPHPTICPILIELSEPPYYYDMINGGESYIIFLGTDVFGLLAIGPTSGRWNDNIE